ncbi:MAG: HlyD family secretion protein [Methylococcus sp.]
MADIDREPRGSCWMVPLICLALAVLPGCEGETPPPEANLAAAAPTPDFIAAAKGRVDIEGGLVKLAAKRDGVVRAVLVEEGAQVRTGQVLAVLDDEQARLSAALTEAELAQARAQLAPLRVRLAAAEREVRRLLPLAEDDTVEQRELDQTQDQVKLLRSEIAVAEAVVDTAARRLKVAEFEIEQRIVRAPGNGRIVRRTARAGDGVSTLNVTPLFQFAPDTPRIVRAELEERYLSEVRSGQAAEITLEADESRRYPATVLRLGLVVGQRTPSDDPAEKQDNRVVECVLSLNTGELLIGQRVIVRFLKPV